MLGIVDLASVAAIFASVAFVLYSIRIELRTKTVN
jgi:hypothetical protein